MLATLLTIATALPQQADALRLVPVEPSPKASEQPTQREPLTWHESLDAARAAAKEKSQLTLLYFTATW